MSSPKSKDLLCLLLLQRLACLLEGQAELAQHKQLLSYSVTLSLAIRLHATCKKLRPAASHSPIPEAQSTPDGRPPSGVPVPRTLPVGA